MALIEREAAKKALQEKVFSNYTNEFYGAMQAIDELPAIAAAPVVYGRWECGRHGGFKCSMCGEDDVDSFANYFPNCGARMDGGEGHAD